MQAETTGLNIPLGRNFRDLEKSIQSEERKAYTNLSSYFGPIDQQVRKFQTALLDGSEDALAFRKELSKMYAEARASGDVKMQKVIERAYDYIAVLAKLQDRLKASQKAFADFGQQDDELSAKKKHASDTYLNDAQRLQKTNELALKSVFARTVAEKALIAAQREALANAGKNMTPAEDVAKQAAASQLVFAQATRQAQDALRGARDAMATVGLQGYAQQMAQINLEIEKQIKLNPENANTWRAVGEAEKQALTVQTRIALFQGQTDNLAMLKAEASAVGRSKSYYDDLMTTIHAKIDLERQGISVTSKAGQAYVENARKLGAFNAEIERQKSAWDDIRQSGGQAIDDLVDGLTGASPSLKNVGKDLLKTFNQLAIANPIKNAVLGTNAPTISDLFTRIMTPSLSTPSLSKLGTRTNPMYVVPVASAFGGGQSGGLFGWLGNLLGFGGKNAANDNVSLGAAARAIKSIESSGNYSALGPFTKSGDRAYGAYQVMGANIAPWTRNAIGYAMTPGQFLASPSAQDAVFSKIFGGYASKYGMSGAASMWFSGRPSGNAMDILGTTTTKYVEKFNAAIGNATNATGIAAKGLGKLGTGFGQFGSALSNPGALGGGGGIFSSIGGLFDNVFSGIGSLLGFANGTDFAPGGMAIVGERGPELVNLPRGAQVISNDRLRAIRPANENAPQPQNVIHMTLHQDFGGAFSIDDVRRMAHAGAQQAVDTVKGNLVGWNHQIQKTGTVS